MSPSLGVVGSDWVWRGSCCLVYSILVASVKCPKVVYSVLIGIDGGDHLLLLVVAVLCHDFYKDGTGTVFCVSSFRLEVGRKGGGADAPVKPPATPPPRLPWESSRAASQGSCRYLQGN